MQSRSDKKMKMWWCYIFHAEPAKSAEFFTITLHAGAGGVVSYATTGERRGKTNAMVKTIHPLRALRSSHLSQGDS